MRSAPIRKSFTRSLRFRLMLWNAAVVIVTGLVTLVVLREGLRITLIQELDQRLHEDLREIEIALSEHEDAKTLHDQLDRKDAGHARHRWFASLVGNDGTVSYQTAHAPPADLWTPNVQTTAWTAGPWRLTARELASGKVTIGVGESLDSIHADVARLDRFVALVGSGVLCIAPVCGYWLAGRTTRPLAKIIETTASLRPSQLNERLEIRGTHDELDQLSKTFNRLLDQIGRYLQERRDFLANSAHELRTPLAAIRSSIEVALVGGRSNEEYEELLADIIEESASLELLVNQVLLLSETETERLKHDKQCVQFNDLVEKAMDMFGGVAEFREIQLFCPASPSLAVHGNQQHLRQVVYNLLDNALKFTPSGGSVKVQLRADDLGESLVFVVRDSGPGIPADELPHVFDRFFQGSRFRGGAAEQRSGRAEQRGAGLGLSICKAIIAAHDGTIEVDSQLGQGTCFTVRLPRGDGQYSATSSLQDRHTSLPTA